MPRTKHASIKLVFKSPNSSHDPIVIDLSEANHHTDFSQLIHELHSNDSSGPKEQFTTNVIFDDSNKIEN